MARSATSSSRSKGSTTRQAGGAARRATGTTATTRTRRAAAPATTAEERKLPRKKPLPGISRVDQEGTRTHGYAARVGYEKTDTGWRPRHTRFFGDRTHGNPTKALKAAEEWVTARREEDEKAASRGRGGRAAKTSR
jgi:hypothetical protein